MKKAQINWQVIAAAMMIFVLIITVVISAPKIKDLAKGFGFFQNENETAVTSDIASLQSTINSLLNDGKNDSYRIMDEFMIDKNTIMVGFNPKCFSETGDGCSSGTDFCPVAAKDGGDKSFHIPKPEECNNKSCICSFKDTGAADFKGKFLGIFDTGCEYKKSFIPGSCITFDGDVFFRGSETDTFNFGSEANVYKDNYLVLYYNGKGKTEDFKKNLDFNVRQDLFVQKTYLKNQNDTIIFISSFNSDAQNRKNYVDILNNQTTCYRCNTSIWKIESQKVVGTTCTSPWQKTMPPCTAPEAETPVTQPQVQQPPEERPPQPANLEIDKTYFGMLDSNSWARTQKITKIVLHHTASEPGKTVEDVVNGMKASVQPNRVSIHYIVDRDGKVYQIMSEDKVAWHAGCDASKPSCIIPGINEISLGIEIMNSGEATDSFDGVYANLKLLLSDIAKRNGIAYTEKNIIPHYEVSSIKYDPSPNFDWAMIGLPDQTQYFAMYPGSCPVTWSNSGGECVVIA